MDDVISVHLYEVLLKFQNFKYYILFRRGKWIFKEEKPSLECNTVNKTLQNV